MIPAGSLSLLALLLGCTDKAPPGDGDGDGGDSGAVLPDAEVFVPLADLGDPIPGLDAETLALYEQGRELAEEPFRTDNGLGPFFNADSCESCHQFPVVGGSAPRYRDFWIVKTERFDGVLEDAGTNGGPVRNLYATHPTGHVPEPADTALYARRNAPPFFGIGLLEFVPEDAILAHADPDDADGDGISGRANYEQGRVGRFGYKSQASVMESFNRGAILNQMGITTNPLFHTFPETPPDGTMGARMHPAPAPGSPLDLSPLELLVGTAHAQVSAPGQPTTDDDAVPDPELSDEDQLALLVFSTYIAAPAFADGAEELPGATTFTALGCADCHVPRLDSTIGALPVYSDLLLHDMGEDRADGIGAGLATGSEFRTQPLLGVSLHGPWLHDGAADSLEDAITIGHGGEGAASRDAFLALSDEERAEVITFLEALGGADPDGLHFTAFDEVPAAGEPGGPVDGLDAEELALWEQGRRLFDTDRDPAEGLGTDFNADSCRACHQDPVLGGAGGLDTSVLRIGHDTGDGVATLERLALPRVTVPGQSPLRLPDDADVVELRQPPSLLGVGLVEAIDPEAILAGADPDDLDGDGISGRARILSDGRLGRLGWKAQIPTAADFAADALLQENGLTVDAALTDFSTEDDGDAILDPEIATDEWEALTAYLAWLAPPPRKAPADEAVAAAGEALFASTGCADCHTPELDGVALYSDLLLHEVAPPDAPLVDQEGPDVLPGEFRTPPLWGVSDTGPWLHDGSAPTLTAAIVDGHDGEAAASASAFSDLSEEDQAALIAFLETL